MSDHKYLQTTSAPLDIIEGLSKVETAFKRQSCFKSYQAKQNWHFLHTQDQILFQNHDPAPVVIDVEEVEASDANNNSSTADLHSSNGSSVGQDAPYGGSKIHQVHDFKKEQPPACVIWCKNPCGGVF